MYDVVAELRDGTIIQARTMEEVQEGNISKGRFPGQVGRGRWGRYRGDATDVKFVVAYASKSEVDVNDLETFVDENNDQFSKWSREEHLGVGRKLFYGSGGNGYSCSSLVRASVISSTIGSPHFSSSISVPRRPRLWMYSPVMYTL